MNHLHHHIVLIVGWRVPTYIYRYTTPPTTINPIRVFVCTHTKLTKQTVCIPQKLPESIDVCVCVCCVWCLNQCTERSTHRFFNLLFFYLYDDERIIFAPTLVVCDNKETKRKTSPITSNQNPNEWIRGNKQTDLSINHTHTHTHTHVHQQSQMMFLFYYVWMTKCMTNHIHWMNECNKSSKQASKAQQTTK